MYFLIFGFLQVIVVFLSYLGIRKRKLSVLQATGLSVLFPIIGSVYIGYIIDKDIIEAICMGSMLSITFGFLTFLFGRGMANDLKKQ